MAKNEDSHVNAAIMESSQEQTLCFVSWNIGGQRNPEIDHFSKELKADIFFLQETKIGPESEMPLEKPIGWKSLFTVYDSSSKGVAILIKDVVPFQYIGHDEDYSGGYLVLFCHLHGELFTLVNVYNHSEDKEMLERLQEYLRETARGVLVVGGDFNTVLDLSCDRTSTKAKTVPHTQLWRPFKKFTASLNLMDTWAYFNPTLKAFTYCHTGSFSRLDMFLLCEDNLERIKNVDIQKAKRTESSKKNKNKSGKKRTVSGHLLLLLYLKVNKVTHNVSQSKQFHEPDKRAGKINVAEILSVIKSLTDSGPKGPDGISVKTYKNFCCQFSEILKTFFNLWMKSNKLPPNFNASVSASGGRKHFNVDYLIFTMILAKRLNLLLEAFPEKRSQPNICDPYYCITFAEKPKKIKWTFLKYSLTYLLTNGRERAEKTPDDTDGSERAEKTPDDTDGSERAEKTPDDTDGSERAEKTPDDTDGSERAEKTPDDTDGSEREEKTPDDTDGSERAEKTQDDTDGSEREEKTPDDTDGSERAEKTPDDKNGSERAEKTRDDTDGSERAEKTQDDTDGSEREEKTPDDTDGSERAEKTPDDTDGSEREEKTPDDTDGSERAEKTQDNTDGSERAEKTPDDTDGSERAEKTQDDTDGSEREEKTPDDTDGSERAEKTQDDTDGSEREEKTPDDTDGSEREEKTPDDTDGSERAEKTQDDTDGSERAEKTQDDTDGSEREEKTPDDTDGSERAEKTPDDTDGSERAEKTQDDTDGSEREEKTPDDTNGSERAEKTPDNTDGSERAEKTPDDTNGSERAEKTPDDTNGSERAEKTPDDTDGSERAESKKKGNRTTHNAKMITTLLKGLVNQETEEKNILEVIIPEAPDGFRELQDGCPLTRSILSLVLKYLELCINEKYERYTTHVCHSRQIVVIHENSSPDLTNLCEEFKSDSGIELKCFQLEAEFSKPVKPVHA